jgi:hypothetical protein
MLGVVDPVAYVDRLIGRERLERDDDLERGEFGLRDPATGERIRVPAKALTRYAMHILQTPPSLASSV